MPLAERNEASNLLLLCRKHHKMIDDDPTTFSIDRLHQARIEFLKWLEERLGKEAPWEVQLSHLLYINVPRLSEFAELQGYRVDLSKYDNNLSLRSFAYGLNNVMLQFKNVLNRLTVTAIPIRSIEFAHEKYIGALVAFDQVRFRTKNIRAIRGSPKTTGFSGNLSVDPHIYVALPNFTFILNVDPKWITTATAFSLFSPPSGQSTFSGLARITNVDYENRLLFGTPLVIGLGPNPMDRFGKDGGESSPTREKVTKTTVKLDDLIDLEEAKKRGQYFIGPPETFSYLSETCWAHNRPDTVRFECAVYHELLARQYSFA